MMAQDVLSALTQTASVQLQCGPSVEKDGTTSLLCIPCENQMVHIYK